MLQQDWNDYYRDSEEPWTRPDAGLVAEVADLPPGRALDLGTGEGADSVWLASQGWEVTAVDFAPAAVATVERVAESRGLHVTGVVADIVEYQPDGAYDLVFLCYMHLKPDERARMLANAAAALAPGGTLLYLGIVRPEDPSEVDIPIELLASPEEIIAELPGLTIERAEARRRTIGCPEGDFEANVMTIRARREVDAQG